ncbi:rhodanese-like domain-containing protein [bacterium]|nr:rhodanese-like domain-containing protein [bacterium]
MVILIPYSIQTVISLYKHALWISAGFLIFSSLGCAQQPPGYSTISAGEFAEMLPKDSGIVLDVRTPGEYKNGHVAQSVLIDIMQADFEDKIKKLDKEKSYYIYCRSGNRSSKASSMMIKLGFKRVFNVKDGIDNILRSGVPVSKD